MRKNIILMFLGGAMAFAQEKDRVGINTEKPRVTLEVAKHTGIPANQPQGVVFPHLTTTERNAFTKTQIKEGTMIYNTTRQCVEYWDGGIWVCLDDKIKILGGERIFVSVYDNDYLPYNGPVGSATLTALGADGTLDRLIDVQGKITTTGVDVYIPVATDEHKRLFEVLHSYEIQVEIPTQFIESGTNRKVSLSWETQNVDFNDYYIKAKIKAIGGDVYLKKLDFQSGLGTDYRGHLIAEFPIPANLSKTPNTKFSLRLMPGIPDKLLSVQTNGKYEHEFIYVPMKASTSNHILLNHALGAEYTNINSSVFDPGQMAKAHDDVYAMGSLFQWGRKANGHELVDIDPITKKVTKRYGYVQRNLVANDPMAEIETILPLGDIIKYRYYLLTQTTYAFERNDNRTHSGTWSSDICPTGFAIPKKNTFVSDFGDAFKIHEPLFWTWNEGEGDREKILSIEFATKHERTYRLTDLSPRGSMISWMDEWGMVDPFAGCCIRATVAADYDNPSWAWIYNPKGFNIGWLRTGMVLRRHIIKNGSGYSKMFDTPALASGHHGWMVQSGVSIYESHPVRCIKQ